MRRGLLLAAGTAAALTGVSALAVAGALLGFIGRDEELVSDPVRVTGDGVALVVDDLRADYDVPTPPGVGDLTLVVTGAGPVFVGEALPQDLDDYLAGAPYDSVVELGTTSRTRPVPGTQQPPPPGDQGFWLRSDSGIPARLALPITAGTSLAILDEDASPGVDISLSVVLRLGGAWTAGWVALGVGLVLLALAIAAGIGARRAKSAGQGPRHATGQLSGSVPASDVLPGVALTAGAPVDPPVIGSPGTPVTSPDVAVAVTAGAVAVDDPDPELGSDDPADADAGLIEPTPAPPAAPTLESGESG